MSGFRHCLVLLGSHGLAALHLPAFPEMCSGPSGPEIEIILIKTILKTDVMLNMFSWYFL